jgi:carbon-monoxide dehydrogenase small subunit
MTVGFNLNGKDVVIQKDSNERLIDILRNEFSLTGAKSACHGGHCGACSILLNDVMSPACLVPVFCLHGASIVTIEGLSKTDGYKDIINGFNDAGVECCGYCTAGKMLVTESLLRRKQVLTKEEIALAFDSIRCRCTDSQTLINGVIAASEHRKRRLDA